MRSGSSDYAETIMINIADFNGAYKQYIATTELAPENTSVNDEMNV